MTNFEFKSYTPTPGEKHLGIAEIKAYGKFVLRYKLILKKDGNGIFPAPATYKLTEMGQERYVPAFTIDSNSDKEECESIIIANVRRLTQNSTVASPQMPQNQPMGYSPIPSYQTPQIPQQQQPSPFGQMHPFSSTPNLQQTSNNHGFTTPENVPF